MEGLLLWEKEYNRLPHGTKIPRRDTFYLFEHTRKIVWVTHATFITDCFKSHICEAQELFGMGDSYLKQVAVDGQPELFFEYSG